MHATSLLKFQAIAETYLQGDTGRVLEVGSQSYDGSTTFKTLLPAGWRYVGLDIADGPNVDLVPKHAYLWDEIPPASYDAAITGQTFEHNPFFWITLAEMARVTRPGGLLFVVAPGRGPVHRYPYDCWRFYPDCWAALATYLGVELIETEFDEPKLNLVESGAIWCDSAAVFRVPSIDGSEAAAKFYDRLSAIRETARPFASIALANRAQGPGFLHYRHLLQRPPIVLAYKYLRRFGNWRRVVQRLFIEA